MAFDTSQFGGYFQSPDQLKAQIGQEINGVKMTSAGSSGGLQQSSQYSSSSSGGTGHAGLAAWADPFAQHLASAIGNQYNFAKNGWGDVQNNIQQGYQNQLLQNANGARAAGNLGLSAMQGYQNQPQDVTGNYARGLQGDLNPTSAMQQLLSGQANNPYLSGMQDAYTNNALRGYNDAMQTLQQTVMPGIRNDAVAAGQYGSSRQGIAEGMVAQQAARNARDLGISSMGYGNQLYGNAYEQAQQRMYGTANNLNNQAVDMAQNNANRQLQAAGVDIAYKNLGLGAMNQGQAMTDTIANNLMTNSLAPINFGWQQLGNASNLANPLFNASRVSDSSQSSSSSGGGSSTSLNLSNTIGGQIPGQIYPGNTAAQVAGVVSTLYPGLKDLYSSLVGGAKSLAGAYSGSTTGGSVYGDAPQDPGLTMDVPPLPDAPQDPGLTMDVPQLPDAPTITDWPIYDWGRDHYRGY